MTVSRPAPLKSPSPASLVRAVQLSQVRNGDPGLKVTSNPNSLTVSGIAKGDGPARAHVEDDRGATVGLAFDHDKMPKFDTTSGYTEKNAWYFAHTADVVCKKGQTPDQVLHALAAKVKATEGYQPTVVVHGDGSATMTVVRKR
jgi:hypothetical protein